MSLRRRYDLRQNLLILTRFLRLKIATGKRGAGRTASLTIYVLAEAEFLSLSLLCFII